MLTVLDKTLKDIHGVRLDNHKGFFVHQVLGPNIMGAFLCRSINYTIPY